MWGRIAIIITLMFMILGMVCNNAVAEINVAFEDGDDYNCVTRNIGLPDGLPGGEKITWISENEAYLEGDGTVHRPTYGPSVEVKLRAVIEAEDEETQAEEEFTFKIIKDSMVNLEDRSYELVKNGKVNIEKDYRTGMVRVIRGEYTPILVECPEEAIRSLKIVGRLLGVRDAEEEFKWDRTEYGRDCVVYYLDQSDKGRKIYGAGARVYTDEDGRVIKVYSNYNPNVERLQLRPELKMNEEQVQEAVYGYLEIEGIEGIEINTLGSVIYFKDWVDGELAWEVVVSSGGEDWCGDKTLIIRDEDGELMDELPKTVLL